MKKSNLILLLVLLFVCGCGCKTPRYVPLQTITVVEERLVPVGVPADSSSIWALVACDSLNKVYVKQLTQERSSTITQDFSLIDNNLNIKFKSKPDSVHVKVKDSVVYREVPLPVPGETILVFKQHWWQQTLMYLGILFIIIIIIYIVYRIWKKK